MSQKFFVFASLGDSQKNEVLSCLIVVCLTARLLTQGDHTSWLVHLNYYNFSCPVIFHWQRYINFFLWKMVTHIKKKNLQSLIFDGSIYTGFCSGFILSMMQAEKVAIFHQSYFWFLFLWMAALLNSWAIKHLAMEGGYHLMSILKGNKGDARARGALSGYRPLLTSDIFNISKVHWIEVH